MYESRRDGADLMRRLRGTIAGLTAFGLIAIGLSACVSLTETRNDVDLSPYSLSALIIPENMPDHDEPLSFLRPDAIASRNNVKIILDNYTVRGSTADALMNGADGIRGMAKARGLDFMARVDWFVTWRYDYEVEGGVCRAVKPRTDLKVTYQIPVWDVPDDAPPALRVQWARFDDRLRTHEYGHALIGYRTQQDVERVLQEAAIVDGDCATVGKALNRLAKAIIDRGLDANYDARTGHGRTQGAVFSRSFVQGQTDRRMPA